MRPASARRCPTFPTEPGGSAEIVQARSTSPGIRGGAVDKQLDVVRVRPRSWRHRRGALHGERHLRRSAPGSKGRAVNVLCRLAQVLPGSAGWAGGRGSAW
jgi:hypothetical protein